MSISNDTPPSLAITSHLHLLDSAWGGAEATALTVGKLSFALLLFYTLGCISGSRKAGRDSAYFVGAIVFTQRGLVTQLLRQCLPQSTLWYVVGTTVLQAGVATLGLRHKQGYQHDHVSSKSSFLKPMLFPARTTHTRLFPSRHSFSYSYLLVGVPVSWQGTSGSLISAGKEFDGRTWFSVNADDYLARDKGGSGLTEKLRDYLSSQGVSADQYPYSYLVTAPCFLGFSFNPVSFWYLYDRSENLSAMVLEVNNTFDERRMYFLRCHEGGNVSSERLFSSSWLKDFHVSPFNDREGSYSLTAKPLFVQSGHTDVDNNIVLKDNEGKTKIVARVSSTKPGIDPSQLSSTATWAFLAQWWWVGFVTNPRILREAWSLWHKNLQVYYRPEVFKTSIGRNETIEERDLEPYFEAFLVELVSAVPSPFVINYLPAAGPNRGKIIRLLSPRWSVPSVPCQSLDIHILTPAFYGEIARSGSITDAFAGFCFQAATSEAMLQVSDHCTLQSLLRDFTSRYGGDVVATSSVPFEQLLITCLRTGRTRCLVKLVLKKLLALKQSPDHPAAEWDVFVRQGQTPGGYKAYLHSVKVLLVGDRLAFGMGWLLTFERVVVQLLCFAQTCVLAEFISTTHSSARLWLCLVVYAALFHKIRSLSRTLTSNELETHASPSRIKRE